MKNELDSFIKDIKNCQISKNRNSCLGCNEFYECKIRISYIDKMFSLMNKKDKS